MTLAPPHALTPLRGAVPAPTAVTASVTAVLVVHDGARWLPECLDSLAAQTRRPDRLVVVDTGSTDGSAALVAAHSRLRQVIGDHRTIAAPRHTSFGAAVGQAVGDLPTGAAGEWLWLLHDDSAAAPQTLARLLGAARRSASVGIAGPKLTRWDDASRLLEVGIQVTRSGRRAGGPAVGEHDQGQYDHRSDVIGVSSPGMLVRRDVFDELGGFDRSFARFRADLDLSWRAHLAGHRVIVVPQASMREAAASTHGERVADLPVAAARRADRRHGRQVALARCSGIAVPFLIAWIALTSMGSALALLLVKRPRRAWTELADLGAFLTPGRVVSARWRARGQRRIRRRDLRGLFVKPRVALRHSIDAIHDAITFTEPGDPRPRTPAPDSLETGPVAAEAEQLAVLPVTWPQRVARHPGFIAVMVSAVLSAVAWRAVLRDGSLAASARGLSGGELRPTTTDASGLWHAALDGWHGAGLGSGLPASPHLLVLAAAAWLAERLPLVDHAASPAGVAIGALFVLAIPLSAWSAYLGARTATATRWPRAWAALAWASLATLTTALGGGRLGAVVAHMLLPLVVAGFACAARGSAGLAVTFGAALGAAVVGAFSPILLVVGLLAALLMVLLGGGGSGGSSSGGSSSSGSGRGRVRLRGLALLVIPVGLLGPWAAAVVDEPRLLLGGPGLGVWDGAAAAPWQLALLHPGGPGSYPVLLSAPIVLAGVAGLLRRGAASRAMSILAVVAVVGLLLALAAPHVVVAGIPEALPSAGEPITAWAGTGLDLMAIALLAAALLGLDGLSGRLTGHRFGWRQLLVTPVVAAAVLGVLVSVAFAGWEGVGDVVRAGKSSVPAVAAEQASGPLANRLLVLGPRGDAVGYRLVGMEPGGVAREVPGPVRPADTLLVAAVRAALSDSAATSANGASEQLSDLAVGFVGYEGRSTSSVVRQLDATAGLARLGDSHGLVLWRVQPRAGAGTPAPQAASVPPARVRLQDAKGAPLQSVDVDGAHGRVHARLAAAAGQRRLVVAEPRGWSESAHVSYDGRELAVVKGSSQPTYQVPPGPGTLRIDVAPTEPIWRYGQLGLLAVVAFLAIPVGGRRARRTV